MMDDIFLQLSKLTEPGSSNPVISPSNTAGTSTPGNIGSIGSTSASNVTISDSEMSEDLFIYDDLITPDLKPQRSTLGTPQILVIDDDFPTLDLMKIYLQRDYEYIPFDNPKDAIFWLNTHVPDLIFIDCYMTFITPRKIIDIIKSNKATSEVPIFYLSEPDELGPISAKLPDGVLGVISRPVRRGDLEGVLNYVFSLPTASNSTTATDVPEEEIDVLAAIDEVNLLLDDFDTD